MFFQINDRIQSISTKIAIVFFFASAVPLVIGLTLINRNSFRESEIATEQHLVELVSSRERLLREHIDNLAGYADALSRVPSVVEALESYQQDGVISDEVLLEAAKTTASMQSATWGLTHHIFLTNIDGTVVLSPPKNGWEDPGITPDEIRATQSPHAGDSIGKASSFQLALHGPAVSGFFGFEELDHYHQLAMHPVFNNQAETIGVVCIEISIDTTQEVLMDNFKLGESGHLFLTTDLGEIVVHHKPDGERVIHPSEGLFSAVQNGSMVFGNFDVQGRTVKGVYLPSDVYPWIVAIEMDYQEVMHAATQQQKYFSIVGGLILLLCGLTGILVARIFGLPIRRLVKSANAVADGDLFKEIQVTRSDEIGQLQGAVDEMRFSLKQQIDELDSKVAMRTNELSDLNEQLKHDSEHDKLTGLANRDLFNRMLKRDLELNDNNAGSQVAVLFFDFDRFKLVNDSLGHSAGDALLCSIADRFTANLRTTDLAARFGGDEFVVMLSPLESESHAIEASQRLLKLFEESHLLDGHQITSTASIGLVIAEDRYTNAEDIIRDADAAMYQAKADGKGRVVQFDQQMHKDVKRRLRLEEDLNKAIEESSIRVAYQPIVDLETLKPAGFEALVRWEHPELGWIRPDQLIEIAEDTGQIIPLGAYILEKSVDQILEWNDRFTWAGTLSVNVNVSKRQLVHDGFLSHLKQVIDNSGISPSQLKIEITESTIVDPRSGEVMASILKAIRDLGVQIAMDDFGTGHSSLSLLHQFKFDVLKIDQSFIRDMELNHHIGAVLHAIIELAKNTGMTIVAEGVETQSQVTSLIAHDCDLVQGYYFAKPMFASDVAKYLSDHASSSSAA